MICRNTCTACDSLRSSLPVIGNASLVDHAVSSRGAVADASPLHLLVRILEMYPARYRRAISLLFRGCADLLAESRTLVVRIHTLVAEDELYTHSPRSLATTTSLAAPSDDASVWHWLRLWRLVRSCVSCCSQMPSV